MKEDNYEFLAKKLQYTGFPESMKEELRRKMEQGDQAFVLSAKMENGKDEATAKLFFKRAEESENYFFNNYRMTVSTESIPDGISRTFPIDNSKKKEGIDEHKKDITFKEAYNLLASADKGEEQRFIYGQWLAKNGEIQNAWRGINIDEKDKNGNFQFKNFHDSYGFNLDKSLAALPIDETYKYDPLVIRSLQRGNLHAVKDENGNQMFISAFPPALRVNLFDANMKLVNGNKETLTQSVGNGIAQGHTNAQPDGAENKTSIVSDRAQSYGQEEKKTSMPSVTDTRDDIEGVDRPRGRGR